MLYKFSFYRSVTSKFGVGNATALRAVRRVTNALVSLSPKYIKWPDETKVQESCAHFEGKQNVPGVIGAIDGTHIKITAPKDEAEVYVNRKGCHSIQLQVCLITIYRAQCCSKCMI